MVIPWADVSFVSPVPALEVLEGKWRPSFRPRDKVGPEVFDAGHLPLRIVAAKRHVPMEMFLFPGLGSVSAKPLYGSNDRLEPDRCVIDLPLETARLSEPVSTLMDLLVRHSRLDLLVDFWHPVVSLVLSASSLHLLTSNSETSDAHGILRSSSVDIRSFTATRELHVY